MYFLVVIVVYKIMLSFPQFDYLFSFNLQCTIYCHFVKGVIKSVKEINNKKI